MNQLSNTQLLDIISHVLELGQNITLEEIICKILVLPDIMYKCLFQHLSASLCVEQNTIYRQFCNVSLIYFPKQTSPTSALNEESTISTSTITPSYEYQELWDQSHNEIQKESRTFVYQQCRKLVPFQRRTESQEQIAFQELFAHSASKLLNENNISNKVLCEKINTHIKQQPQFWVNLSQLISHKTHVQLRDYYNKSFSKFMYQVFISVEHKLILRDMYQQTPNDKPSKIVERFIESTGNTQYFKRNLVMYLVNMKNKQK
ncbi:Hypothetical_protein [Hexamita inflata]|uniref:Hypothetical_protein n=1 Tax=Hexamita inflata TaxID=28002 RepID=A0AA86TNW8_9EUKA|nr:Hypothetical protein HINF_LOCUS9182 [Hexamita inflata]